MKICDLAFCDLRKYNNKTRDVIFLRVRACSVDETKSRGLDEDEDEQTEQSVS